MCLSDVVVASWTATAKVGSLILDQDNLHICYYQIMNVLHIGITVSCF